MQTGHRMLRAPDPAANKTEKRRRAQQEQPARAATWWLKACASDTFHSNNRASATETSRVNFSSRLRGTEQSRDCRERPLRSIKDAVSFKALRIAGPARCPEDSRAGSGKERRSRV